MLYTYSINTEVQKLIPITSHVRDALKQSGVTEGICLVYCPHTTAGITINENADPDVASDFIYAMDKQIPERPEFRHAEGNTAAHLKASFVGSSAAVPISGGSLKLGTWQGIYFCEFDGPRRRSFSVTVIGQ